MDVSKNEFREESDTFGPIKVPAHKYWGAQTQRSLQNFAIGTAQDKIPLAVVKSLAIIKKCAAKVNNSNKTLSDEVAGAIVKACDEIIEGKFDDNFPLVIFQTGSGTQSNMNLNEVIANRAIEILGGTKGQKGKVHPNDHVNQSQSSNDTFPTAMHVAVVLEFNRLLLPSLNELRDTLSKKVDEFASIIKIGRTHLQDATPLTLGQEFSGYLTQVNNNISLFESSLKLVKKLAQGGTAVGTGLNSKKGWDVAIAKAISEELNIDFVTNENKFESLATHDALTAFSGSLNTLATSLFKVANDIRILSTELKELVVSNNDVSPCEELLQACVQTVGNCNAVSIGNVYGNFELNVFKPLIVSNILDSIYLLSSGIKNFNTKILSTIQADHVKIKTLMDNSLMLVTALNPYIGYENAAKIAKHGHKKGITLKEAALDLGLLTAEQFDQYIKPEKMISPDDK